MSYADPQEFYVHHHNHHHHEREDEFYNNRDVLHLDRTKVRQSSIYTIPGYIPYSMSRHDACTPCDVSINLKGEQGEIHMPELDQGYIYARIAQVDNLSFQSQEPPTLPHRPNKNNNSSFNTNDEKVYTPSSQSTDATLEKKSRFKWRLRFIHPETGDWKSCFLLSIYVLAVVLCVAALGVVLYITVGGGMEHFVSNKSELLLHTGDNIVDGTFRISSVAYDADLANSSSVLYNILRREISQAINLLFTKSTISQYYNRSQILDFRNGSVVVNIRVFLTTPLQDVEARVTSGFVKGLINMHGTVLLDKFVIDIRSIKFKVTKNVDASPSPFVPTPSLTSTDSQSTNPLANLNDDTLLENTAVVNISTTTATSTVITTVTSMPTQPSEATKTNQEDRNSLSQQFDRIPSRTNLQESSSSSSTSRLTTETISSSSSTRAPLSASGSQVPPPTLQHNVSPLDNTFIKNNTITTTSSSVATTLPPINTTFVAVTLSPSVVSAIAAAASTEPSQNIRPMSPQHPFFLRPPPDRMRPYFPRHSRPTLPSHLQADFADSPGWGSWTNWSPCGLSAGQCESGKNDTQTRTRDCRNRNGDGEVLSDARECLKRGGARLESRKCQCPPTSQSSHRIPPIPPFSPFSARAPAHQNSDIPDGRPCHECTDGEICLAKHSEKDPTCRKMKDANDPTQCGGLCDPVYEYCQHLSTGARKCIDDRVCLPDEWQCGDGLCIPSDKRCDGHFNCYDTTDEMNCKCDETQFRCGKNTSCLPLQKRCNQIVDCWDGSDEENCTKQCPDSKFTCNDGQCIPNMYFCDGLIDCSDGSDEPDGCNVTFCIANEFRCSNGRCIKQSFVCDGSDTCGDGSDESSCGATIASNIPLKVRRDVLPSVTNCSAGQFLCGNKDCVDLGVICNGRKDCADGSDESACSSSVNGTLTAVSIANTSHCSGSGLFSCSNGKCIDSRFVCDSLDHCGDSSDELETLCQRTISSH